MMYLLYAMYAFNLFFLLFTCLTCLSAPYHNIMVVSLNKNLETLNLEITFFEKKKNVTTHLDVRR